MYILIKCCSGLIMNFKITKMTKQGLYHEEDEDDVEDKGEGKSMSSTFDQLGAEMRHVSFSHGEEEEEEDTPSEGGEVRRDHTRNLLPRY